MTPTPMFGISDSTYKTMGEEQGVRQLVDCFYNIMACTKAYQPLFNLHPNDIVMTKDKLSRFLMAWMGGERTYQSTYLFWGMYAHATSTCQSDYLWQTKNRH